MSRKAIGDLKTLIIIIVIIAFAVLFFIFIGDTLGSMLSLD